MPDPLTSLSLHSLVHDHRDNLETGMYYYIAVFDHTDDGAINDCEYAGSLLSTTGDELTVQVRYKRTLIEGNEQEWVQLEPENMTFAWLDVDSPYERPCIRFYRTVEQS